MIIDKKTFEQILSELERERDEFKKIWENQN